MLLPIANIIIIKLFDVVVEREKILAIY